MVDVAAVTPQPKWKVRKVSAVRDFPPGCGRHTAPVNPAQTVISLSLVKPEEITVPDASSIQLLPSLETSLETPKCESVESVEIAKVVGGGKVLDEAAMLKLEKEDGEEQMVTQKQKDAKRGNEMGFLLLVPDIEDKDQKNLVELAYDNGGQDVSATVTKFLTEPSKVGESVDTAITGPVPVEPVKVEVPEGVTAEELMFSIEMPHRDNVLEMSVQQPRSSEPPQSNLGQKRTYSKTYPPPKRRKVSAVRDFPPGCGRNAALVNVLGIVEDAVTVCHSAENLSRCLGKQDGMIASAEASNGNLSGETFMDHNANGDLPVMGVITAESCSNLDIIETAGENVLDRSNSHNEKDEAPRVLVGNSSSGGVCEHSEEEINVKQRYEKVSAESFRKVEVGKGTSDADLSREEIQGMSSEAHARSVPRNSSCRKFSQDSDEKEVLERPAKEKKSEMHEVRPVSTTTPFKETHQMELARIEPKRIKPIGELVDNEPKPAGGVLKKASARSLKDITKPNINISPTSKDRGYDMMVLSQSDESSGDLGTKVTVQSLMASQSCPWRQGKKSSDLIDCDSITPRKRVKKENSISVTLQNKVKREGTFSRKKVSEEPSTSECKKKGAIEEDEEAACEHDCNSDKVLKAYKSLLEMNVNLIPLDPSVVDNKTGDGEERVTRNKVKKALRLFQVLCRKLLQGEEAKKKSGRMLRIDLAVAGILKKSKQWVNVGKPILGEVPGVEVGDEFHFRVELSIVGLHRPFQGGIDWTKRNDTLLATSIVASGGYPDEMENSDVLIYSGQGGKPIKGKKAGDQKLERGNLALKNSIDAQTPVRVIRGYKEQVIRDSSDARGKQLSTFTYDGLYHVEKFWPEMDKRGYQVFKFRLKRIPGQPELAFKELSKSKKSKIREGQCIADISGGKERRPICVVNTIDDERPAPFKYITKIMYPSFYVYAPPAGCGCTRGCSDSENCACAVKNGGEIPFNFNGAIVQAKPLVYECGPSCKCPPSCHNRVSQNGIKMQLEVFKTKSRGWGVRSLRSIPAGTFICEYIGELLKDTDAEQRSNDEYLFDIGHNYDDHSLWEGLPNTIPGLQSSSHGAGDDDGFTIDAAESGNVGRFINHSCSPNLYAQNVLFDHDDKRMPHIMFFAADNIPPLQELTYHYNYTIDKVHDSNGNIKRKSCYCGSPECTGRLY